MDKQLYKSLLSKWKKPIYQGVGDKKSIKTLQYISLFKDKKVVDLGSNAGVITYDISQYAKEIIGVEYDVHYYKQSLLTLKYIKIPCKFINTTVGDFIRTTDFDYNAIFASCVLYHLKKEEIDAIKDIMIPKCDIVIFISREDKKQKYNNPYNLNRWENIRDFVIASGMSVDVHNTDSNWATVVGNRCEKV
jgi:tRNA A58 N-methylase Trm61